MKLVPDWKDAWKWWSVRFMALAAAWPVLWMQMPPDAKTLIPATWEPWIPVTLICAGLVGRVKDQS